MGYCLVVGGSGWYWLLAALGSGALGPLPALAVLLLFGLLALIIDILSFRVPPNDAHSLVGMVLLTALLAEGPAAAVLLAAVEGLIFGVMLPFIYGRQQNFYNLLARPLLRSGLRALGLLSGLALAHGLSKVLGLPVLDPTLVLLCSIPCYALILQLGRSGREYLQGGRNDLYNWWRATWRLSLAIEFAPLPLAALWAAIYTRLGLAYFLLGGIGVIAASAAVRRAALNLQTQRRSVRELAQLNEVSRAIIRSELDVDALCDLIYREASRIVDTSTFHLGLFQDHTYTLMVRVQDRVRLPRLSFQLEPGDGIIGWMRQTGRALLVEDFLEEMNRLPARPRYQNEFPPRSGIYVPLIVGETVIGSISIQSYKPRAFEANDLRLLSLIADQAAVAISRAREFHAAQQRAVQLQAIHEVSERITAILNLEELLPSVVRLIRERFHYHPVHIFTIESGSDLISFRASTATYALLEHIPNGTLRMGMGIVGSAAASAQPVLVGDVHADPRYISDDPATRSELAVPLRVGDQVIGVLDVQSDQVDDFDAEDLFVMRTLADQIAIAIDSANSYQAQQEEAWTLNALLQVAENINRATTLEELLSTIVRLPPLLVGCDRCYCLLWNREAEQFELCAAYGLTEAQRTQLTGLPLKPEQAPLLDQVRSESYVGNATLRPIYLAQAQQHASDLAPLIKLCGSGTLVALPILARSSLLGALLIDYNAANQPLGPRQVALYIGASGQIANALESALLAREADEAARLEQELQVAREIQTALLPSALPRIPGWEIAADWRSARLVGGDFYDFWPLAERKGENHQVPEGAMLGQALGNTAPLVAAQLTVTRLPALAPQPAALGFVIADVSDKGVPAAMFMALSRSLVRAAALDGSPPPRALERANRWITRDSESGMFVTLFYGMLDVATGLLRYTCAGHNPPLIYHSATQSFEELATPGIALGVIEEISLTEAEARIEPGDLLLCYTDGVTEAINHGLEAFGTTRLRALVMQHYAQGAAAVVEAINTAVSNFTSGQPPFDDVTLVVLRRLPDTH